MHLLIIALSALLMVGAGSPWFARAHSAPAGQVASGSAATARTTAPSPTVTSFDGILGGEPSVVATPTP